jgi:16S rRNA (cytidine1402-2'-O)-methyltransferase
MASEDIRENEELEQDEAAGRERTLAPGLYLVATPIGNLEDMTLRGLRVLRSVDRIACEDTRQTQKLLNHFGIRTPTVSYHRHNEAGRAAELMRELKAGARIAVVSDAGTPGVADPGGVLAAVAVAAGVPVVPIPGANAAICALVASGLSREEDAAGGFRFHGFLPAKEGQRRSTLEALRAATRAGGTEAEIFYEAPHRIVDTLRELETVFGPEQHVVLGRELTKLHEEFLRGPVEAVRKDLAGRAVVRGEFVLVFVPAAAREPDTGGAVALSLGVEVKQRMERDGLSEMDALKQAARGRGIGKSQAYRELQRERGR